MKYSILTFFLCALLSINACKSEDPQVALLNSIAKELPAEAGTFAIAYKNLVTGHEILVNEKEVFHAASTMKTPVMIEVYKQVDQGLLSLADSIIIKNSFYSIVDSSLYSLHAEDDSEVDLYTMLGKKKSLNDLVYDMIIVSSNLATNLVIDLVNAKKVTATMRSLGAMDIEVLRGVEDGKAYEKGLSNTTTAYDMMLIYEKLANGEIINKEASDAMINILLNQKFNEIIPAFLPVDVKVAHKTGVITALHHDTGIIFLPDGTKYVLVLLSKKLNDFDEGTQRMARVSKLFYDYTTN